MLSGKMSKDVTNLISQQIHLLAYNATSGTLAAGFVVFSHLAQVFSGASLVPVIKALDT